VLVAGGTAVEVDKVSGLPPAVVDRIVARPSVDVVIVEADGARRLPFKAPSENEPVIPASATIVVPVVGLDVIGQPLAPGFVHRPERVARLTGARLGDPVTAEMVAQVLAHAEGGAKGVPGHARLVPFLNKVRDDGTLSVARTVARQLLNHPQVDSVLIGSAQSDEPVREVWSRVGAVVLAAGQASRYGSIKQLLPWQGVPLVAHVAGQALSCADIGDVVVALGAAAGQVGAALEDMPVDTVMVEDWSSGQSRSVQAGLRHLLARQDATGRLGAVLFLLADQPSISPALLSALVRRHRETLAAAVAPRYGGQRGNPALFDRGTFGRFAGLRGDVGARQLLAAYEDDVAWLDWHGDEILWDIDTPEDYRRLDG